MASLKDISKKRGNLSIPKSSNEKVFLIRVLFEWILISAVIAYVFYQDPIPFFILIPGILPYGKNRLKQEKRARNNLLSLQFRESILSVSTALNAGYSVENAFIEAYHDMRSMYGEDAAITMEYRRMVMKLRENEPIEYIIKDFAMNSDIEDIYDFANVFEAAKRIGGDMTKIIKRAAANISEKIDVKREIETSVSAKRYEIRVMELVPFGILLYLQVTSEEFLSVLYHNITGVALMTVCLGIYGAGFYMAEKILQIEV